MPLENCMSPLLIAPRVKRSLAAAFLLSTTLLLGMPAHAAPTSSRFEPNIDAHGTTLYMNGAGTRYKAVFKVYDMALYTVKPVGSFVELQSLPGPKKLQFVALRELSTTDLGRLFTRGMADNSYPAAMNKHVVATTQLIQVFSSKSKLMPGDSFAIEFVPGKGLAFYHQGKQQGEWMGDQEFFHLVMGIWFGPVPADYKLRDALLNKEQ
jgi:hypothetical protein